MTSRVQQGRVRGPAWSIAEVLACAFVTALFGCQTTPPAKPSAGAANHPASSGYLGSRHDATTSTRDVWRLDDQPVGIDLLAPAQTGPQPLVIYLPGLGESCDAGEVWRRTWAEAGYAVLCAQPAAFGETVWSSERARSGDFVDIARDAYAGPALVKRVAVVREMIAEVRRRQEAGGETPYAQIDLSRIAVGGFDLGAQTAMVVAGEVVSGVAPQPLPAGIRGVVALSPYTNSAGQGSESAFRSVRLPVLLVTSDEDVDPYGLVRTASARRAAFQYLPAGKKFLLVLSQAPYSLLSGARQPQAIGAVLPAGENASTRRWKRDSEGGDGQSGKRSKARRALEALPPEETPARSWTAQLANIASVTTAYLDAVVRDDATAAAWLTHSAKPWLSDQADLQIK